MSLSISYVLGMSMGSELIFFFYICKNVNSDCNSDNFCCQDFLKPSSFYLTSAALDSSKLNLVSSADIFVVARYKAFLLTCPLLVSVIIFVSRTVIFARAFCNFYFENWSSVLEHTAYYTSSPSPWTGITTFRELSLPTVRGKPESFAVIHFLSRNFISKRWGISPSFLILWANSI